MSSNFDYSQKNLEAEKSVQKSNSIVDPDNEEQKSGAGQQDAEKKGGKVDGDDECGEKGDDGESSEEDDDGFFDNISNANDEKRKEME